MLILYNNCSMRHPTTLLPMNEGRLQSSGAYKAHREWSLEASYKNGLINANSSTLRVFFRERPGFLLQAVYLQAV